MDKIKLQYNVDEAKLNVFVEEIRRFVGKELKDTKIQISVLILPTLDAIKEGEKYFPVLLFSEFYDNGVFILVEHEDLYIVAMRPKIDEEPWLIFRDDEKNEAVKNFLGKYYMIYRNGKVLEPKFAPFGVSYGSLEKYSRSRSTIPHADVALQDDVLSLGKKQENKKTKELALPITVVIGNVSEATRFKSVLGSLMVGCKRMSNEILWHERNWGNLSEFIDEYASGNDPTLTHINNISTYQQ